MKLCLAVLAAFTLLGATASDYLSAKRKIDSIGKGRLEPGTRVVLTPGELKAYAEREAPDGVRNIGVELGQGSASGSAMVDFLKLRKANGEPPGMLTAWLLEGERPVRVTARIDSGGGKARVKVESVEISGVAVEGRLLDFLIRNYVLSDYPEAKIDQPFELGHRMERLEVVRSAVNVVIGR
jgi:hypothetical protein